MWKESTHTKILNSEIVKEFWGNKTYEKLT